MAFHPELVDILLRPIRPERVKKRPGGAGKQLSYVEGYEIRAALNRMFGFGAWSLITQSEVVHQEERLNDEGARTSWVVTAKAHATLQIHYRGPDPQGEDENPFGPGPRYFQQASYEDVAAAGAANINLGEAMDMAIKTAATDALKRCAMNLGDQFGLSLYNDGSLRPVVRLVVGHVSPEEDKDKEPEPDGPTAPAPEETDDKPSEEEQLATDLSEHDAEADSGAFK